MIVKVDAEKAASLGVQWAGGAGTNTLVGAGANFTGFGKIPALTDVLSSAADQPRAGASTASTWPWRGA